MTSPSGLTLPWRACTCKRLAQLRPGQGALLHHRLAEPALLRVGAVDQVVDVAGPGLHQLDLVADQGLDVLTPPQIAGDDADDPALLTHRDRGQPQGVGAQQQAQHFLAGGVLTGIAHVLGARLLGQRFVELLFADQLHAEQDRSQRHAAAALLLQGGGHLRFTENAARHQALTQQRDALRFAAAEGRDRQAEFGVEAGDRPGHLLAQRLVRLDDVAALVFHRLDGDVVEGVHEGHPQRVVFQRERHALGLHRCRGRNAGDGMRIGGQGGQVHQRQPEGFFQGAGNALFAHQAAVNQNVGQTAPHLDMAVQRFLQVGVVDVALLQQDGPEAAVSNRKCHLFISLARRSLPYQSWP